MNLKFALENLKQPELCDYLFELCDEVIEVHTQIST